MKTNASFLGLVISGCLALAAGCGKNENSPPAPPEPAKPPTPAAASAAGNPDVASRVQPATNAAVATPKTEAAESQALPPTAPAPAPAAPAKVAAPTNAPGAVASVKSTLTTLAQDQVAAGLQEALGKGLQHAIAQLGREGGFLTNVNVRIPIPEKLQKVETALRAMKQDKIADDVITTFNHAAEQAVPAAGGVFVDALKQMTVDDAKAILSGPNDAATRYFQQATQTNLYAAFYPIVQKATEASGATAAYKTFLAKANVGNIGQRLGNLGNAISGALLDKDALDIDAYVTNKTLDGLFKMVAEEEKQIRQNPAARTTQLLQTVFGALKK